MRNQQPRIDKAELVRHINAMGAVGLLRTISLPYTASGPNTKISCPWHTERTPSCSVRLGTSGDVVAHCFSCGVNADAIDLVAKVLGCSDDHFGVKLERVATAVGLTPGVEWDGKVAPRVEYEDPEPDYPSTGDKKAIWDAATSGDLEVASEVLPAWRDATEMARVLMPSAEADLGIDCWDYRGGHLMVKAYDARGEWRSVHGRALRKDAHVKNKWPKNKSAAGLFFADDPGLAVLQGKRKRKRRPGIIMVTEGLTDTVSEAARSARRRREGRDPISWARGWDHAVIGINSGSVKHLTAVAWPIENVRYIIATDHDEAGSKYADQIRAALPAGAQVMRLAVKEIGALRRAQNNG